MSARRSRAASVWWLAIGATVLSGCAVSPTPSGGAPQPSAPVVGTAYPGSAYPGSAYPGTAYPGTAYPGTAYPGTVAPPSDAGTEDLADDDLYRVLVAEFAGQRGHLDVAVEQYLALARTHRDPELAQRATKIAVFARNDAAALEAAGLWVDRQPTNLEARQIIAAMYIRHGDAESALQHLEYVLDAEQANPGDKLRMIANLLGREKDQHTALAVMEKLAARSENDPDALLAYALLTIRAGQLEKAREIMARVMDQTDITPGIAMAYLTVLQKQGLTQEAIDWLDQVLTREPGNFGLRLIYARLLADSNRYEEARMQFVILAREAPGNTDVVYALGLFNLQASRIEDAEKNFTQLLEVVGRRDDAYYYLGQIAESRKLTDQALKSYRAIEGGRNYFPAQLRIAFILSSQGKIDMARKHLREVTAENAEQELQLLRVEAEILTEHERYDDAMSVYDEGLAERYDSDFLYARAMLAEKMDRLDILERDLRTIIEQEPENAQALNALGYTLANRTDRYQEAHELIKRALELSPDDFYILDSMGWVLYRLGRLHDSVPYLEKARKIRNEPEVAAHLGEVLWVLGDKDAARNVWESVLRDQPDDKTLLDVIERLTP